MGCSTRLGPSARTEGPHGVHRISKDTSILNVIQINQRLPFRSLPFPPLGEQSMLHHMFSPPYLTWVYINSDCGA